MTKEMMKKGRERTGRQRKRAQVSLFFSRQRYLKFCTLSCVSRNIHDSLRQNGPMDILQVRIVLTWRIATGALCIPGNYRCIKKETARFYPESYDREITVDRF